MTSLNALCDNASFRKTSLFRSFAGSPLGFVDIGAAGEVSPAVMPAAGLVHCTCFEPDRDAYQKLCRDYARRHPFSRLSIVQAAVGSGKLGKTLRITHSAVNSSLLRPSAELTVRYGKAGFRLRKKVPVTVRPLDEVVFSGVAAGERRAEFIKLDCQGAELDVLSTGSRTLREQCVALICEVDFFPMYHKQDLFAEVDRFLRGHGFCLYGLYPNFISAQKVDRRKGDSEERLQWADAVYFKDPLFPGNRDRRFSRRDRQVLLLAALLTGFYDFALELSPRCAAGESERRRLERLISGAALEKKRALESDAVILVRAWRRRRPAKRYLLARKFVDAHRSNSSIDFIKI